MATKQVTVTVDEALVRQAKATAARRCSNLSAYTAAALREALLRDAMDSAIAEGYVPIAGLHDELAEDLDVA